MPLSTSALHSSNISRLLIYYTQYIDFYTSFRTYIVMVLFILGIVYYLKE